MGRARVTEPPPDSQMQWQGSFHFYIQQTIIQTSMAISLNFQYPFLIFCSSCSQHSPAHWTLKISADWHRSRVCRNQIKQNRGFCRNLTPKGLQKLIYKAQMNVCHRGKRTKLLFFEWNSIRLGGPAHEKVTKTAHKTLPGVVGSRG